VAREIHHAYSADDGQGAGTRPTDRGGEPEHDPLLDRRRATVNLRALNLRGRNLRALLLPLPLLLAGCGVVAAFIPPIGIGDPLAVEGQSLTTTFGGEGIPGLTLQVLSEAESTVAHSFEDIELDLRGFSLSEFHAAVGMDPVVVLQAPDPLAAFPDSFDLVGVAATATVSDEVHGEAVLSMERSVYARFELDADSCAVGTCSYRYADGDPFEDLLSVRVTDWSTLAAFVQIVRLDGDPSMNTGTFSVRLTADSEPSLDGFSATFTLRSGGTVIKLGG
jgi:hypothetical protein